MVGRQVDSGSEPRPARGKEKQVEKQQPTVTKDLPRSLKTSPGKEKDGRRAQYRDDNQERIELKMTPGQQAGDKTKQDDDNGFNH